MKWYRKRKEKIANELGSDYFYDKGWSENIITIPAPYIKMIVRIPDDDSRLLKANIELRHERYDEFIKFIDICTPSSSNLINIIKDVKENYSHWPNIFEAQDFYKRIGNRNWMYCYEWLQRLSKEDIEGFISEYEEIMNKEIEEKKSVINRKNKMDNQ